MRSQTRALLQKSSTATLSTQLHKRNIRSCYMSGVRPLTPSTQPIVGPAYTLRYIPYREDHDPLESLSNETTPSRLAIENCPPGSVLVADARGLSTCATLGDILAHRLKARGVAGFVSDGAVRDSAALGQAGLPIYCSGAAAPASLNGHIPIETQVPIACGEVAVYPDDIVVADADGVVIVPKSIAEEISQPAAEQEDIEEFIALLVRQGHPIAGTYPPNEEIRARYEAWVVAGRPIEISSAPTTPET